MDCLEYHSPFVVSIGLLTKTAGGIHFGLPVQHFVNQPTGESRLCSHHCHELFRLGNRLAHSLVARIACTWLARAFNDAMASHFVSMQFDGVFQIEGHTHVIASCTVEMKFRIDAIVAGQREL